jgi:hypothetical protein
VVEQVEQHRLSPLEIVHVEHERSRRGERLEKAANLPEELFWRRRAAGCQAPWSASTNGQNVIPSP